MKCKGIWYFRFLSKFGICFCENFEYTCKYTYILWQLSPDTVSSLTTAEMCYIDYYWLTLSMSCQNSKFLYQTKNSHQKIVKKYYICSWLTLSSYCFLPIGLNISFEVSCLVYKLKSTYKKPCNITHSLKNYNKTQRNHVRL